MRWCEKNQDVLVNREPVASVGLIWSQRNTDFYGRDDAAELVDAPYTGCMHALVRARIPYLPIHIDDIASAPAEVKLLILPNLGGLSDKQCDAIRVWVVKGGSLLATGDTSLYTEWGDPRKDYGLADIFGAHRTTETPRLQHAGRHIETVNRFTPEGHTYLRLPSTSRHEILKGFEETDILPYGGKLVPLKIEPMAQVPLTYVPPFPTYPPETSWMREPITNIPGLVLTQKGKSRVAFLQADLDRRYAKEHLPDHGNLLANLIRWAVGSTPVTVEGPGLIDVHLYRQSGRLILHLVNLTNAATWRAPIDELIPVGPIKITVGGQSQKAVKLLVSNITLPMRQSTFEVPSILDHEVIVIG